MNNSFCFSYRLLSQQEIEVFIKIAMDMGLRVANVPPNGRGNGLYGVDKSGLLMTFGQGEEWRYGPGQTYIETPTIYNLVKALEAF